MNSVPDPYYSHHYQAQPYYDSNVNYSAPRQKKTKTVIAKPMEEIQKQMNEIQPEKKKKKRKKKNNAPSYADIISKPATAPEPPEPKQMGVTKPTKQVKETKRPLQRKKNILLGDMIGTSIKDMKKRKKDVISQFAKHIPGKTILNVIPKPKSKKAKNRGLSLTRNVSKGKQRMTPKKKRLSKLKKIIMSERNAEKKQDLDKEWFTEDEREVNGTDDVKSIPKEEKKKLTSQIIIREYVVIICS
jgi:hypothetical protein